MADDREERLHRERDEARRLLAEARERVTCWQADHDMVVAQRDEAHKALAEARAEVARLTDEVARLRIEYTAAVSSWGDMEGQAALDAARDEIDRLRRTIEENAHEMARVRRSAADSVEVVRGAHAESARLRGSVAGWLYVVEDALERDAAGQARALTLMRDQMRMALAGQQRLIAEARGLASAARAVVDRLRASRIGRYEDQFPGHGHLVPGIWDTSAPPALAGKPCEDCAAWNALRSLLSSTGKEESDGRP